jgi:hypothetical protein
VQRADSVTGSDRLVRSFGGQKGIGRVDRDEGVQPGLQPLDACEAFVYQIDRRQTVRGNLGGQSVDGTKGN